MYPQYNEITLYDAVTPVAVTSSTDATPIVVTATAHGLITGDRVLIYGHTTNIAANGIFKITKLTADTFSLQDEFTGADIAGSGAGAGASGLLVKAPPILLTTGYRNIILQVNTSGTATTTLKVAASLGKSKTYLSANYGPRYDFVNMGATVLPSNPYTFVQSIDLDTAATLNGATGFVATGADLSKQYEVNVNAMKYLTVFPISWTQGVITVKALMVTNS
jgi:hypothetical protein